MPPHNTNTFSQAIGGARFPIRRMRGADLAWLNTAGQLLARGRCPRLGRWLVDWVERIALGRLFEFSPTLGQRRACPDFREWGDDELADAGQFLDAAVHTSPLPIGAGKLVDRLQAMLGVETRRRQRQIHLAQQVAALEPGQSVTINGVCWFAPPADIQELLS